MPLEITTSNKMSCSTYLIVDVRDARNCSQIIRAIQDQNNATSCVYHLFSDVCNQESYDTVTGKKFAKFIKEQGLGTVTETAPKYNPKSGNHVVLYIWELDREAVRAFTKMKPKRKSPAKKKGKSK